MVVSGILAVLTSPVCILLILFGVFLGIVFGAIPGLSATLAVALCLPMTFGMEPLYGLSMLIGLYVGAISGGLISAILLKIPGTPASIATCFDGHPMAARGEAGKALGTGILYSFIGGMLSVCVLIFIAPSLASITIKFGPFEYFSVGIFSLTMIGSLAGKSMVNGLISGLIGIMFALFGAAPIDGMPRFTFGFYQLETGFELLPALIGLFAISEILKTAEAKVLDAKNEIAKYTIKGFGVSMKEFKEQFVNMIRSFLIGLGIGILPGIGGGTSNLIAYSTAKNASKHPEKFGTGIPDGIVASETANNASVGGALVPLLTLGIPGDGVTAVLLGGLLVHDIQPGPMLFVKNGALMYGIFTALILAHIFMIVMEFGGLKWFVKLLDIPKSILLPIILVLCTVGAYSLRSIDFDVWSILLFGLVAYLMEKVSLPASPVVLGFILGPIVEVNLRRALMYSQGSIEPFFTRPFSLLFIVVTIVSVIIIVRNNNKRKELIVD